MTVTEFTIETLTIPEAPPIPGLVFRYFRGEADYPNIIAVFDTCKDMDGFEYTLTVEDSAHHFENLTGSDPFKDMIFVEIDGQPIAYSRVGWFQEDDGDYIYYSLGFIRPEWRRKGIGTAILRLNECRIREIATDHPKEARKYFQNDVNDPQVGLKELLKGFDYKPMRWGYQMSRPTDDPLPDAPMPENLQVRPVKKKHHRLIWEAMQDAFRGSWGFVEGKEEDFQRWKTDPHFNPKLWKVGWDGDQIAGMVLSFVNQSENEEYCRKRGWTDPICVRAPWRWRSLARSLLVQSIHMFKEMGFDETALDVDTQNPNNALRLYQGVGYQVVKGDSLWRKPLT